MLSRNFQLRPCNTLPKLPQTPYLRPRRLTHFTPLHPPTLAPPPFSSRAPISIHLSYPRHRKTPHQTPHTPYLAFPLPLHPPGLPFQPRSQPILQSLPLNHPLHIQDPRRNTDAPNDLIRASNSAAAFRRQDIRLYQVAC